MRREVKRSAGLVLLAVVLVAAVARANENPSPVQVAAAKILPAVADAKVHIVDQSRVLTKDEVDKLANKEAIPVVKPLEVKPSRLINPKLGFGHGPVVPHKIDDGGLKAPEESNVQLPPIPLIAPQLPQFLQGIFDRPSSVGQMVPGGDGFINENTDNADQNKPKGIVSVMLLKSSHRLDDAADAADQPAVKSSFIIVRYLPKSISNWFGVDPSDDAASTSDGSAQKLLGGGDDDVDKKPKVHLLGGGDDDVDRKRFHLFGGDEDVDKKRVHLLGGGGESDPDRLRLNRLTLDENDKGVFTGGNSDVFSSPIDQHRMFIFSMFDRLRSMFQSMQTSLDGQAASDSDEPSIESAPFISIRTDDGQSALIPNDIGYAEKQAAHEQSLNKCMMLQFMRLKASMYYRTILHLLFFTGLLLFVLSLAMLTLRAVRRRRMAARHHISIATIEASGAAASAGAKSKLAAYRAWQGLEQSSLGGNDKTVLIQAPPAYDQVYIQDKNSTLTSGAPRQLRVGSVSSTGDECETKSLPPEYEEKPASGPQ